MFWFNKKNKDKEDAQPSSELGLVVIALGNVGAQYAQSRHNAGWVVLDALLGDSLVWNHNKYAEADCARAIVAGHMVEYVKPRTMMNNSGISAQYAIEKHNIAPDRILVIYDDIDLPIGKIKMSFNRGSGGHNGIRSIENHLGTPKFIRLRIGISKELEDGRVVKPNVLGNFEPNELKTVQSLAPQVEEAIQLLVTKGREKAMNEINASNVN